jgi:hypothetical protein
MRRAFLIFLSVLLILASIALFASSLFHPGWQLTPSNPLNTAVKAIVSTVAFLSGLVSLIKNVKDLVEDWRKSHPSRQVTTQAEAEHPTADH